MTGAGSAVAMWIVLCGGSADDPLTGAAIQLAGGTIEVSVPRLGTAAPSSVIVHFHGAGRVTADNLRQSKLDVTLVTVNFKGLSSAYARPFQRDPALFDTILVRAADDLRERQLAGTDFGWDAIYLSSFSAGYGAARAILAEPRHVDRISGYVAADSIYAGLDPGVAGRRAAQEDMRAFRNFARLAAEKKKRFVVSHTMLETPYASTFETAADLLDHLGLQRRAAADPGPPPLVLNSSASRGTFTVLGYEGTTGEAHLDHLRNISRWWAMMVDP